MWCYLGIWKNKIEKGSLGEDVKQFLILFKIYVVKSYYVLGNHACNVNDLNER